MGKIFFIYLFLNLTTALHPVVAQQQVFKTYSYNDGLVANSVRRIFQDSKKFLWIATYEGLSRYDGNRFGNYNTSNGLSHNMVNDIFENDDHSLYIACNDGGISRLASGSINKIHGKLPVMNRFINAGKGVLITTDMNGIYEFNNGKVNKPVQANPNASYHDLSVFNDSLFIAATDSSLQLLNRNFKIFAEDKKAFTYYFEARIFRDSQNRTWIACADGLKLLSARQQKDQPLHFEPLPTALDIPIFRKHIIKAIMEDNAGNTWFGSTGGLVKISPEGTFQLFNEKNGLPSDYINAIFQDSEQNIWIGTSLGLAKLVTKNHISIFKDENAPSSNKLLFIMPLKNGNLLVQTEKELRLLNKIDNSFSVVKPIPGSSYYGYVKQSDPPLLFNHNSMAVYNETKNELKQLFHTGSQYPPFFCAVADKNKNIFTGTQFGLWYRSGNDFHKTGISTRIDDLLVDRNGILWIGTWDSGLVKMKYDLTAGNVKVLSTEQLLPGKNIRTLFEDRDGHIWVGTRYDGVFRVSTNSPGKYIIQQYNQQNGLTSNWIKSIAEDENGAIWIGFYQGLDKLIPGHIDFRVFNFSRINNYFTALTNIITTANHNLWLGSQNSISFIHDGEMEKTATLPVYITTVNTKDSLYTYERSGKFDEIKLDHRHNQLQFEFTSPSFINEKQVLYSYRLKGSKDESWSTSVNQHIVSYANLQPGRYGFEVKALGWNGSWGQPASFSFVISPPFWKTTWFIITAAIVFTTAIYWLTRRRIALVRHEAAMKNNIREIETMALRSQMNPHFIFNCLNSIDNLIQSDQKEKATDYLAKFAKLLRDILENSKNNTIPCWKDLETLKLYLQLEALRWDHKIDYSVTVSNEIQDGDHRIPPMLIQPFVENSIHHGLLNKIGNDKKLSIDVRLEGSNIKYSIADNGIGRIKAMEYKKQNRNISGPLGIQITKERIGLFNQDETGSVKITDLYDDQQQSSGTLVEIWLNTQPLKK